MPNRIVDEELRLLSRVTEALDKAGLPEAPSETALVDDLEHIREQLRARRDGFLRAFVAEHALERADARCWSSSASRASHAAASTAESPYFAHLRLRGRRSGARRSASARRRASTTAFASSTGATRRSPSSSIATSRATSTKRTSADVSRKASVRGATHGHDPAGQTLARIESPEGVRSSPTARTRPTGGAAPRKQRAQARRRRGSRPPLPQHRLASDVARRLGTDALGRRASSRADKRLPRHRRA